MAVKDIGFTYQADYSDVGLREIPARIGFTYHREPLTLKCLPQVLSELEVSDFSSLDCETTGLEFDSCQLVSVNLSYTVGTEIRSYVAFYSLDYCLAHFPDRLERLPSQQAILDLVALALSRKYCSMHNRMFDQRVLLHAKPLPSSDGTMASSDTKASPAPLPYNPHSFNQTWDTLDMFWFLDSNVKGGLGLKELGRKYLGIETTHYEEAVGLDILSSPPRSLLDYGALDTYMTLALFRLLLPIFLQRYPLWFKMIPLAKTALYFMEEQHQYFNLDKALEMREVVTKELEALKEEFYSKYGYVNLGSNLEKSRLLFRLGYYTGEDNKPRPDGERIMKTSAPLLEKLASSGCEVADYMVRFSKLSKFLGTYMEPIILHASEREDGSKLPVRFHFFDCRVPTGRYASGKYTIGRKPYPYFLPMNLQSISKPHSSLYGLDFDPKTCSCTFYGDPLKGEYCVETGDAAKNIRSIFAAPPGYVIVRADYCSEELVIMANLSGEKVWLDAIRNGQDIHESTARSAWRLPPDARVDKNLRKKAKVCFSADSWVFDGSSYVRARTVQSLVAPDLSPQGFHSFVEPAEGYEVYLSNGQTLRVSAGHLFRCYDADTPEWVPVEQCLGRQLGILKEPLPGVPQVIPNVGLGMKSQCYHGDIEVDDDVAYLLGLALGGGSVNWAKGVPAGIQVVCHQSSVPFVNSVLSRFHFKKSDFTTRRFHTYSVLTLNSRSFAKFFVDNCGYTKTKHIPDLIFSSPVSVRLAFIAGLLDSDGTVRSGTVSYCTTSSLLRDGFVELCALTGIHTSVSMEVAQLSGRVYGDSYRIHLTQLPELPTLPLRVDYKRDRFAKLKRGYTGLGFNGLSPSVLKERVSAEVGSLYKKLTGYDSDINSVRNFVRGVLQKVGYRNRFLSEEHLKVYPVDVVDIKSWSGDVWVVETDTHQYLAEGQIVHNCSFGLGYALPGSYFPLVAMAGLPEDEARELEYTYRAGLPTLYAWKESVYQQARMQGYVRTSFGHERRLRSYLSSPRKAIRDFALKTSVSHRVQGEAGGIMRLALIKLYKLLYSPERRYNLPGVFNWQEGAEVNPDVWFLNVVHDEICLVARVDIAPKVARDLSSLMSSCTPPGYTLPLEAEPEIGPDMGRTFPVHVLEAEDGSLYFQPVSEARPEPKVSVEEPSKAPDPLAGLVEVDTPDGMDVLDGLSF